MPQNEPKTQSSTQPAVPGPPSARLAETGKGNVEDLFKLPTEFSKYFQEANRAWLARMQSEASLASQFASELVSARSLPATMAAWQHWAERRIELLAEDSKRLLADTEKLMETGGRVLGNGWTPRP